VKGTVRLQGGESGKIHMGEISSAAGRNTYRKGAAPVLRDTVYFINKTSSVWKPVTICVVRRQVKEMGSKAGNLIVLVK
jgi:hypothetical protein